MAIIQILMRAKHGKRSYLITGGSSTQWVNDMTRKLKQYMCSDSDLVGVLHNPNLASALKHNQSWMTDMHDTVIVIDENMGLKGNEGQVLDAFLQKSGHLNVPKMMERNNFLVFVTATPGAAAVHLQELGPDLVHNFEIPFPASCKNLERWIGAEVDSFYRQDVCGLLTPQQRNAESSDKQSASYTASLKQTPKERFRKHLDDIAALAKRGQQGYHIIRIAGDSTDESSKRGSSKRTQPESKSNADSAVKDVIKLMKGSTGVVGMFSLDSETTKSIAKLGINQSFRRDFDLHPDRAILSLRKWTLVLTRLLRAHSAQPTQFMTSDQKESHEKKTSEIKDLLARVFLPEECTDQLIVLVQNYLVCSEYIKTDHIHSWWEHGWSNNGRTIQGLSRLIDSKDTNRRTNIMLKVCMPVVHQQIDVYNNGFRYDATNYSDKTVQACKAVGVACALNGATSIFDCEGSLQTSSVVKERVLRERQYNRALLDNFRRKQKAAEISRAELDRAEVDRIEALLNQARLTLKRGEPVLLDQDRLEICQRPPTMARRFDNKCPIIIVVPLLEVEEELLACDWTSLAARLNELVSDQARENGLPNRFDAITRKVLSETHKHWMDNHDPPEITSRSQGGFRNSAGNQLEHNTCSTPFFRGFGVVELKHNPSAKAFVIDDPDQPVELSFHPTCVFKDRRNAECVEASACTRGGDVQPSRLEHRVIGTHPHVAWLGYDSRGTRSEPALIVQVATQVDEKSFMLLEELIRGERPATWVSCVADPVCGQLLAVRQVVNRDGDQGAKFASTLDEDQHPAVQRMYDDLDDLEKRGVSKVLDREYNQVLGQDYLIVNISRLVDPDHGSLTDEAWQACKSLVHAHWSDVNMPKNPLELKEKRTWWDDEAGCAVSTQWKPPKPITVENLIVERLPPNRRDNQDTHYRTVIAYDRVFESDRLCLIQVRIKPLGA